MQQQQKPPTETTTLIMVLRPHRNKNSDRPTLPGHWGRTITMFPPVRIYFLIAENEKKTFKLHFLSLHFKFCTLQNLEPFGDVQIPPNKFMMFYDH